MHRQNLTVTRFRRIVQREGVEPCLEDVRPGDDAVLAHSNCAEDLDCGIAVAGTVNFG